jgi:hypothetical protein
MDTVILNEGERIFVPSCWRMIVMHTGATVVISIVGLFVSSAIFILLCKPIDLMLAIGFLSILDFSGLFFFTLLYSLNRDLFSIKIDSISVTGPHRFCARHILRNEIDPARSMHRNLIDRFIQHWHVRDTDGIGIAISGLDFRADEIAEILKTIGLEMT